MTLDIASIVSNITGLTQDSRAVEPGFFFAAFPGEKFDGREFIGKALANGARYILAPSGTQWPENIDGLSDTTVQPELITDDNPRHLFALIAAAFYKEQPAMIAAVTGTNGKTSVVSFLQQLWSYSGERAESLGTLSGKMTTLETVALHKEFKRLREEQNVTHLAMEASSHGLDQSRLDGASIKVAGFTNLSRDHLDYHQTMENYLQAKARLFSEVLLDKGIAVLNADVAEFDTLKAICEERSIKVIDYGYRAEYIRLVERAANSHGQVIALGVHGNPYTIELPLVGEFQAMNALCALGMAIGSNPDKTNIYLEALEQIKGAPGRLQLIDGHPEKAGIYVDYAHTPDALETVLNALRPHVADGSKLVCVFGCGGDRDKGKRPIMGEIASRLADAAIVTDDNPRSENPASIRAEILSASSALEEIGDRREAIRAGILQLRKGDILLIAGKGHEQGQSFATHTDHFDDAEEAANAIQILRQEKD